MEFSYLVSSGLVDWWIGESAHPPQKRKNEHKYKIFLKV